MEFKGIKKKKIGLTASTCLPAARVIKKKFLVPDDFLYIM
jgi:hypothetical protein